MFAAPGALGPRGRVRGDRGSLLLEYGFMALIVAFLPAYVTLGHRRRPFAATERKSRLRSRCYIKAIAGRIRRPPAGTLTLFSKLNSNKVVFYY